ncbi:hypothetical protein HPB48_007193 [Haemaphysalis longicornis]|uniref:Uncharacterized protein n=1 Tax=Haemaphysalis longicornis TaxID=44386 RepID=A0A9J6G374_HAELO|nr:hypothetical protein HPB48_007193 [Haemaphysalis longicornis]
MCESSRNIVAIVIIIRTTRGTSFLPGFHVESSFGCRVDHHSQGHPTGLPRYLMASKEREGGDDKKGEKHGVGGTAASSPAISSVTRADHRASDKEPTRSTPRSHGKKDFSSESPKSRDKAPGKGAGGAEPLGTAGDEEGERKQLCEAERKREKAAATDTPAPPFLSPEPGGLAPNKDAGAEHQHAAGDEQAALRQGNAERKQEESPATDTPAPPFLGPEPGGAVAAKPRERWVEVADSEAGEKPRLVTAAVSGICKRRPYKVGGRLVGPSAPAKPFKLSLNAVNEITLLRRIFTPDQLTRPAKSASLAEASREGATASSAVHSPSRGKVGGSSTTQPRVAGSVGQTTGQAGTLALAARAGKLVAGLVSDCPGGANEPGNIEAPLLRFSAVDVEAVGQTANAHLGASKPLPYHQRPCPNGSLEADAAAEVCGDKTPAGTTADGRVRTPAGGALARDPDLRAIQPPSAQTCARDQAYPPVFPYFDEPLSGSNRGLRNSPGDIFSPPKSRRGSAASNVVDHLATHKSLPSHVPPCSNGFAVAEPPSDSGGVGIPARIAAAARSGLTHTADVLTSDIASGGTGPTSAQACALPQQGPPVPINVDKASTSCDNGSNVALDKLLGSPKSRRSFTASNADKLLLAGAVNRGSPMRASVDKGAAESHFACAGGESVKRVHEKGSVLKLRLLAMRVVLALWASLTGCRSGSPDASSNAEHRDWRNNQGVDFHLQAAPD